MRPEVFFGVTSSISPGASETAAWIGVTWREMPCQARQCFSTSKVKADGSKA